jgi:acetaldehyde dehydrogenase/alcohol dehydrogenase
MPNISRAFIVTDPVILKLGYINQIVYYLNKRKNSTYFRIFSEVESDPSVETIERGVRVMNLFQPDVIIALGGGSAIDAAKGMWLFYENPETNFDGLRLKFMDIRKRAFHFPNLGKKAQMVAIPTTSGTGSEVTSFSVITDKKNGNIKYPLADYELTPDVAIIDPQFVTTMPKSITADTGLDVLTHAIEAYVSVLASDYTDGLAIKSIELVFQYLSRSWDNAEDFEAREKMHNASCIAGMAFTNAFLGINHSLAHKLGSEFHLSHGRANAILQPHVIRYNSQKPTKFTIFPKYGEFIADQRYAQIARMLDLPGTTHQEQIESLITEIRNLMKRINVPLTLRECGIEEDAFLAAVPKMAEHAFEDQCTNANPRYPLVSELEEIYRKAYYGTD